MIKTRFGEPRPKGYAEMRELMDNSDLAGEDVYAIIEHEEDPEGGIMNGWSAEVLGNEAGENVFTSHGYGDDKDGLIADLKALSITKIELLP